MSPGVLDTCTAVLFRIEKHFHNNIQVEAANPLTTTSLLRCCLSFDYYIVPLSWPFDHRHAFKSFVGDSKSENMSFGPSSLRAPEVRWSLRSWWDRIETFGRKSCVGRAKNIITSRKRLFYRCRDRVRTAHRCSSENIYNNQGFVVRGFGATPNQWSINICDRSVVVFTSCARADVYSAQIYVRKTTVRALIIAYTNRVSVSRNYTITRCVSSGRFYNVSSSPWICWIYMNVQYYNFNVLELKKTKIWSTN